MDALLKYFIKRVPKIELHLHLEGAIRPVTALDLINKYQIVPQVYTSQDIKNFYRFGNLSEFIMGMRRVSDNIRTLEDLKRITMELLEDLWIQNVHYAEFDCAIQKYIDLGFPLEQIVDVLHSCAELFERTHSLKTRMVVNLQRVHGSEKTAQLVEQIIRLDHPFIIAIGLSGDETKFPQQLFRRAFDIAREAKLHRTAHAGEAMGFESVWSALKHLNVERIDHGTRSIENRFLVDHLCEHQIPLTQCLSSNLRLNVVNSIVEHPFSFFFEKGIPVTLNTDDPQVFGVSLTDEYNLCAESFHFGIKELVKIIQNAVEASFLPENEKMILRNSIFMEIEHLLNQIKLDTAETCEALG